MEGRGIGTKGLDKAAGYIAGCMKTYGLSPADPAGYFQCFDAWTREKLRHDGVPSIPAGHESERRKVALCNVVGVVRASVNTSRAVVVGAHYDHLGYSVETNADGDTSRIIFSGADDNASGVAALLLLAEAFSSIQDSLAANIILAGFSGEESGLLGSEHFVNYPTCPADSIIAMVNLDMVGRLRDGRLLVASAGSGEGFQGIFEQEADGLAVSPVFDRSGSYSGSDSDSFLFGGIPAVHLFTDVHSEYNTPDDDAEFVNGDGGAAIARLTFRVVRHLAMLNERPRFNAEALKARKPSSPSGRKVFSGVIPLFGGNPVDGVPIRGVVKGSPAALAGIRDGDVITGIDEKSVSSLAEYSEALGSYKPGQKAELVFQREGRLIKVEITLAERPDEKRR